MQRLNLHADSRNAEKQKRIKCLTCGDNIPVGSAVFYLTSSYHSHCVPAKVVPVKQASQPKELDRGLAPVLMHWWILIREAGIIKKSTEL